MGDQWLGTSGGARLRGHAVFLKCSKSSLTWYAIRVLLWWPLPETSSFTSLTLPTSTLTLVIPVNHKWPRLTATQTIKRRNIPLDTNCFANKSFTYIFQIKQFYMTLINKKTKINNNLWSINQPSLRFAYSGKSLRITFHDFEKGNSKNSPVVVFFLNPSCVPPLHVFYLFIFPIFGRNIEWKYLSVMIWSNEPRDGYAFSIFCEFDTMKCCQRLAIWNYFHGPTWNGSWIAHKIVIMGYLCLWQWYQDQV